MTTATAKQTMDNYLKALLSFGDYADYLADDVALTFMGGDLEINGREAVAQFIDFAHRQAFRTDIQVRNLVYGENTAMLELEFKGTHTGEFQGIAATNRPVSVPYAAVYDLENEKITALRLYLPMDVLIRQIS